MQVSEVVFVKRSGQQKIPQGPPVDLRFADGQVETKVIIFRLEAVTKKQQVACFAKYVNTSAHEGSSFSSQGFPGIGAPCPRTNREGVKRGRRKVRLRISVCLRVGVVNGISAPLGSSRGWRNRRRKARAPSILSSHASMRVSFCGLP